MNVWSKIKRVLFTEHFYVVAYRRKKEILGLFKNEKSPFHMILPTKRYWHADPMVWTQGGRTFIFSEMFDRMRNKGRIGITEIRSDGTVSGPKIILCEPFHLSFPCVFKVGEDLLMIPETSGAGQLRLYSVQFPGSEHNPRIELIKTADIPCLVDTIPYISTDGDKLYLLSCLENQDDYQKIRNKLKIYRIKISDLSNDGGRDITDAIYDVTDSNIAEMEWSYRIRNGGMITYSENKSYRVVQYSERGEYGVGLELREIDSISDEEYREHTVAEVRADDIVFDNLPHSFVAERIHTYTASEQYEVIDAYISHTSADVFIHKLVHTCISSLYGFKNVEKQKD